MNYTNRNDKILSIGVKALAGLCILLIAMLSAGCGGGGGKMGMQTPGERAGFRSAAFAWAGARRSPRLS